METPSTDQIRSYLDPNAFATARKEASGISGALKTITSSNTVKARNMEDSYRLLSGALERLGTLRSNLQTLQELSIEANQPKTTDSRKVEIYGMMRSLTAGVDILVDETRFDGKKVLDGSDIQVSSGTASTTRIKLDSLKSSEEEGLDLSRKVAGVRTEIFFDASDQANNALAGVLGLDISGSKGVNPAPGNLELSSGDYQIKVHYAGHNSLIELFDSNGSLLSSKEPVDLSGNGKETVNLDSGVELTFDKEQLSDEIDKYDFEEFGPAILLAKVRYERINRHELDDGRTETVPEAGAELAVTTPPRASESGTLSVAGVKLSETSDPERILESGTYRVEINYQGNNSTATLYNREGRMVDFLNNLNLGGSGQRSINFDRGFSLSVDNKEFGMTRTQLSAQINYTKEIPEHEVFDFEKYGAKVNAALERADTQYAELDKAQEQIVRIQQARMGAGSAALNGAASLNTGQLLSTLLGGSGGDGLLSLSQANAQTNLIGMQILQQANASILTQTNNLPAGQAAGLLAGDILSSANTGNPNGGLFRTLLA